LLLLGFEPMTTMQMQTTISAT